MSTNNLDWLFSPAGELSSAQKLFADRLPQQDAFDASLESLLQIQQSIAAKEIDPQDITRPRSNILHFFGIGGIGKTEIVDRLFYRAAGIADKTEHWSDFDHADYAIPCFYDLARHHNPTPEGLLLSIRQSLAAKKIKCPAFDLLIARYWAINNPGESLDSYLTRRSQFSSVDEKTGLTEQIEAGIGEAAALLLGLTGGVSGSAIVKIIKSTVSAISKSGLKNSVLKSCQRLEDMLKAPATIEALPFYASALAWDLGQARIAKTHMPLLIVFLDHLEEMEPQLELMIQQIVWLLPNVLFVSSGRNHLRWSSTKAAGLFRNGPTNWPLLVKGATEEPRQHRVGALSLEDTTSFLNSALVDHSLSSEDFERIADASGGYPYHLDLMVQHWAELKQDGEPKVDDLLVPFPDLARRVLKDLGHRERRVLFACTLFDQFNSAQIASTAGVEDGIVRAFLKKPLLRRSKSVERPFALDRTLRAMFLLLAEEGYENWSVRDWRQMSVQAITEIQNQFQKADSSEKRFWLAQAFQITRRFDLDGAWLVEAAAAAVDGADWDPAWDIEDLTGPDHSEKPGWTNDLAKCLRIIFSRQSQPRDEIAEKITQLLSPHTSDHRFDVCRYFAAQAHRDAGNLKEAQSMFQELISSGSKLKIKATHGMIQLLRRQGRIDEALKAIDSGRSSLPAPDRLQAEVEWTQGLFDSAAEHFAKGRIDAAHSGKIGEAWLCAVYHAFALLSLIHI